MAARRIASLLTDRLVAAPTRLWSFLSPPLGFRVLVDYELELGPEVPQAGTSDPGDMTGLSEP
jgi:hypothetical protein